MRRGNLFDDAVPPTEGERFHTLLKHRNLVVERIVSSASTNASPYAQSQDEWVVLVRGTATLEIDGHLETLAAGDYVFLAAGTPHSVAQVSAGALWLAVHLQPDTEVTASGLRIER